MGDPFTIPTPNTRPNRASWPHGKLSFADGVSAGGSYVELRAEMDLVYLIFNCPQINNPCNAYNPTPVRRLIWD